MLILLLFAGCPGWIAQIWHFHPNALLACWLVLGAARRRWGRRGRCSPRSTQTTSADPKTHQKEQSDPELCSPALVAHIHADTHWGSAAKIPWTGMCPTPCWPGQAPVPQLGVHWQHSGHGDLSIAETPDVFSIYFCTLCHVNVSRFFVSFVLFFFDCQSE